MNQVCNPALAPTPPMGWNSWDCYGVNVTEAEVKANALFMASRLKEYGWEYIVVDLGWYAPGVTTGNYKKEDIPMVVDEFGRLIPVEDRFPSSTGGRGFKPISDYVHSLGLKFGIHIMRGMPWIAASRKMPVKGTAVTCDQIADRRDKCLWYNSMYGIDCTRDGAQEYYDSLIELYTSWGVDFIKADDMGTWDGDGLNSPMRTDEIEALAEAIRKHGNRIVLSISPGAAYLGDAGFLSRHAHMWRISCDFWDNWEALKKQFPRCASWSARRITGHWPDADMLPLGRIGIRGEIGSERNTCFTRDEQLALMTLWCIFRSPLMFGGDLPGTDEQTLRLLCNKDLLEIHRHSVNNRQAFSDGQTVIWTAGHESGQSYYTAVFNLGDVRNDIAKAIPQVRDILPAYDILNDRPVANGDSIIVEPHGVRLFLQKHPFSL